MRSDSMKTGITRAGARALLKGAGFTDEEIERPIIGIANSWTNLFPGHMHLDKIAEAVSIGITLSGGTPIVFNTIGVCDGIASGNFGMNWSLPSREVIADSIEIMVKAHYLDAIVLVAGCDKVIPGMLMAAARLNIPAIIVTAGPMMVGRLMGRQLDLTSIGKVAGGTLTGKVSTNMLKAVENEACPGCGSCAGMFTANSMSCMTEVLGLGLPGTGTIPAVNSARLRLAKHAGKRIVEMIYEDLKPSDIMTKQAFINAITIDMLIGCSTNTTLHLPAIANELGIEINIDNFDVISRKVPNICHLSPSGSYHIQDLHEAGGMSALINLAISEGIIDGSVKTATGNSLVDVVKDAKVLNDDVIRPISNPFVKDGGLAVLKGNLAPEGAVIKTAAVDPSAYKYVGHAKVFNSEAEASKAVQQGKINKGDVIVVRYEGPKGGPGMQEMVIITALLDGMGLSKDVALVTDGRYSGVSGGIAVGHVSPEAALGGPIGLVEEGDIIEIDIPNRKLSLHVLDNVLNERKKNWICIESRVKSGYLARYAEQVGSAARGAVVKPRSVV